MSITKDFEKRSEYDNRDHSVTELLNHARELETMLKRFQDTPLIMAIDIETRFRLNKLLNGVE